MTRKIAGPVLLATLPFFGLTAPVQAQACRPLIQLAALDMTPLPGDTRMTVPVSANGVTQNLLLATGAGGTSFTAAAGQALGLHSFYNDYQKLLDFNGYASVHYFTVDNFKLGKLQRANFTLMATPDPHAGTDPPFDGVLAADLIDRFDVDMDFAAHKLNIFAPDHCPGKVVYWTATTIGVAPITIGDRTTDMERAQVTDRGMSEDMTRTITGVELPPPVIGTDIRTTVILDGKPFTANIDTGEELSTLNTDSARVAYQVTADSPGSAPDSRVIENAPAAKGTTGAPVSETVVVNAANEKVFQHNFHTLVFGGMTIKDPLFRVRPDMTGSRDPNNTLQTGSRLLRVDDFPKPEVTIGMNVLRQFHLYFAFHEGKLYLTQAAPPPAH